MPSGHVDTQGGRPGESWIPLRCGFCNRRLATLLGSPTGLLGIRGYGPNAVLNQDPRERGTFTCHRRRCGKSHEARRDKLDAAFRRALDAGDDAVWLPSDLRMSGPPVAHPVADLDGNRR